MAALRSIEDAIDSGDLSVLGKAVACDATLRIHLPKLLACESDIASGDIGGYAKTLERLCEQPFASVAFERGFVVGVSGVGGATGLAWSLYEYFLGTECTSSFIPYFSGIVEGFCCKTAAKEVGKVIKIAPVVSAAVRDAYSNGSCVAREMADVSLDDAVDVEKKSLFQLKLKTLKNSIVVASDPTSVTVDLVPLAEIAGQLWVSNSGCKKAGKKKYVGMELLIKRNTTLFSGDEVAEEGVAVAVACDKPRRRSLSGEHAEFPGSRMVSGGAVGGAGPQAPVVISGQCRTEKDFSVLDWDNIGDFVAAHTSPAGCNDVVNVAPEPVRSDFDVFLEQCEGSLEKEDKASAKRILSLPILAGGQVEKWQSVLADSYSYGVFPAFSVGFLYGLDHGCRRPTAAEEAALRMYLKYCKKPRGNDVALLADGFKTGCMYALVAAEKSCAVGLDVLPGTLKNKYLESYDMFKAAMLRCEVIYMQRLPEMRKKILKSRRSGSIVVDLEAVAAVAGAELVNMLSAEQSDGVLGRIDTLRDGFLQQRVDGVRTTFFGESVTASGVTSVVTIAEKVVSMRLTQERLQLKLAQKKAEEERRLAAEEEAKKRASEPVAATTGVAAGAKSKKKKTKGAPEAVSAQEVADRLRAEEEQKHAAAQKRLEAKKAKEVAAAAKRAEQERLAQETKEKELKEKERLAALAAAEEKRKAVAVAEAKAREQAERDAAEQQAWLESLALEKREREELQRALELSKKEAEAAEQQRLAQQAAAKERKKAKKDAARERKAAAEKERLAQEAREKALEEDRLAAIAAEEEKRKAVAEQEAREKAARLAAKRAEQERLALEAKEKELKEKERLEALAAAEEKRKAVAAAEQEAREKAARQAAEQARLAKEAAEEEKRKALAAVQAERDAAEKAAAFQAAAKKEKQVPVVVVLKGEEEPTVPARRRRDKKVKDLVVDTAVTEHTPPPVKTEEMVAVGVALDPAVQALFDAEIKRKEEQEAFERDARLKAQKARFKPIAQVLKEASRGAVQVDPVVVGVPEGDAGPVEGDERSKPKLKQAHGVPMRPPVPRPDVRPHVPVEGGAVEKPLMPMYSGPRPVHGMPPVCTPAVVPYGYPTGIPPHPSMLPFRGPIYPRGVEVPPHGMPYVMPRPQPYGIYPDPRMMHMMPSGPVVYGQVPESVTPVDPQKFHYDQGFEAGKKAFEEGQDETLYLETQRKIVSEHQTKQYILALKAQTQQALGRIDGFIAAKGLKGAEAE